VGTTGFKATIPNVSFREITYEADRNVYLYAGAEPKKKRRFFVHR
jgi:hypothetical protein